MIGPDFRFWILTNLISEDQESSVEDLVDDADAGNISESELVQQHPGVNLINIWFYITNAPENKLIFCPW